MKLTDYVQIHGEGSGSLRGNLALVDAGVSLLHVLDDQDPLVGVRVVSRHEALVRGVRVLSHGQNVDISVTYPRYL